ncbi:hypothetical protein MNBD_ALPHA11-1503 [hydrothermal vent metagenome]|uniref:Uncharacterized protein n=1 Tax=hydrothermal vent metagenome TaxID=652676 RepID=A0A3B0TGQ9_9ZZZZ
MIFSEKTKRVLTAFLFGVISTSITIVAPAQAQEISSTYTQLDLDNCKLLTRKELGLPTLEKEEMGIDGGRWLCVGYNNSIVYVSEGDLRFFVSFGQNAMREPAASQTLAPFNYLGETLEWRVKNIDGSWVPFATILRWTTEIGDGSQPDGSTLIVTKLEQGNVCQVARIDAKNVADANQVARDIADTKVDDFNCQSDQIILLPG